MFCFTVMVYRYPFGVSIVAFICAVLSFVLHLTNLLPGAIEVLVIVRIAFICKLIFI